MKTQNILLPTDFSDNSLHAIRYAISLFDGQKVNFVLMNAYHFMPMAAEASMTVYAVDFQKESKYGLKKMADKIKRGFPEKKQLKLKTLSQLGFPIDAIEEAVKKEKIDMVVMGTKGAHGLQEMLLGTNTAGVIQHLRCPVLAIPEKAHHTAPKKIVLAADFKKIEGYDLMKPVAELAKKFNSVVLIIHIQEEGVPPAEESLQKIKLDAIFRDIPHSFHIIERTDPIKGIEEFIKTHDVDLLTMVARPHRFPENLLHKSVTRKLAMHTPVPLLALHEEQEN